MNKKDIIVFVNAISLSKEVVYKNKNDNAYCKEYIKNLYLSYIKSEVSEEQKKIVNSIYSEIRKSDDKLNYLIGFLCSEYEKELASTKQAQSSKSTKSERIVDNSEEVWGYIHRNSSDIIDEVFIPLTYSDIYRGGVRVVKLSSKEFIQVRVSPFDFKEKKTLASNKGTYYRVSIAPQNDPNGWWLDDNDNLHNTIVVHLYDALLGTTLLFENIDKSVLRVEIPELSKDNDQIILPHQGWPSADTEEGKTDLILTIRIKYPEYLSEYEKEIIKKLRSMERAKGTANSHFLS